MKKTIWKNVIHVLVALLFLVGVWILAYFLVGNELLVPAFSDCLKEVFVVLGKSSFWSAFLSTVFRVLFAFFLSLVLAGILAVISYLVPAFGRFFTPIVSVLRSLPTLAVLLIILVWAGAGKAPTIVAFLSLFPMLYTGITAALFQVDKELLEMSRVYEVPLKRRILELYLPSIAPYALRESGAALAFSLKLVVSAEVLANTYNSLGYWMQEARLYSEMPRLFALVIVIFLFGLLVECLVNWLANAVERRVK